MYGPVPRNPSFGLPEDTKNPSPTGKDGEPILEWICVSVNSLYNSQNTKSLYLVPVLQRRVECRPMEHPGFGKTQVHRRCENCRAVQVHPEKSPVRTDIPDHSSLEKKLLSMPELRPVPWRSEAKAHYVIPTGCALESSKMEMRLGVLLATRGDVMPQPCKACKYGPAPFDICIALEGIRGGACANCTFSSWYCECSLMSLGQGDPEV